MTLQAKFTEARTALVSAVRVISQLELELTAARAEIEGLKQRLKQSENEVELGTQIRDDNSARYTSENKRLRDALQEALEMAEIHVRGHVIYKTPHDGDCTRQAHTCLVCLATSHANEMRSALFPEEKISNEK